MDTATEPRETEAPRVGGVPVIAGVLLGLPYSRIYINEITKYPVGNAGLPAIR